MLSRQYERNNEYKDIFDDYVETGSAYETSKKFINHRTGKHITHTSVYYAVYSFVAEHPKYAFEKLLKLPYYTGFSDHDLMVDTIQNCKTVFGGSRYSNKFVRAMENLDPEGKYEKYYSYFIEQNSVK